ncbi:MAG: enoyl-CoA hydratase [Thermoleophilaceae bacterium]|nr:enoyl-CoA hydratase [Thermoleophilaceae bacterium]
MGNSVRLEQHGDVGVIVLDSPPLNLFGEELMRELVEVVDEVAANPPRALVYRAEGKIFTGGVDVDVFHGLSEAQGGEMFGGLISMIHKIEELPLPTVACIHGLCLTAGFEVSLACDMIWASESAKFGLVEIVVGLTPAMGGTQRLAALAGPARAREFVMTGGLYDAATLERWNVVNRVLPDDQLLEKTMAFAERLAAGPTKAHAATKRIVRAQIEEGVRGADARVGEISGALFETEDLKRAVETFLDKGPGHATFEGR